MLLSTFVFCATACENELIRGVLQLKRMADRMVTLAKNGRLDDRRELSRHVRSKDAQHKVFTVFADRYKDRTGGYTRVLRCNLNRQGDNAPMAWIEYIDRPGELRAAKPPAQRLPYSKMMRRAQLRSDEDLVGLPPRRELRRAVVPAHGSARSDAARGGGAQGWRATDVK